MECNSNNRVKENRECGILDIKCWMFIGVSDCNTSNNGNNSKNNEYRSLWIQ